MIGKILGGVIGFFAGGPWGAVIGVGLGHFIFDTGNSSEVKGKREKFLEYVCMAISKVAKVDGAITRSEIDEVENLFKEFNFTEEERLKAIDAFRRAKNSSLDINFITRAFASDFTDDASRRIFMICVCRVAISDGDLSESEIQALASIAKILRLNLSEFINVYRQSRDNSSTFREGYSYAKRESASDIDWAYAALGVSKNASDDEIKKEYRRRCKELHPDILRSRGLGEFAIKALEQELAKINDAYEAIKKQRI